MRVCLGHYVAAFMMIGLMSVGLFGCSPTKLPLRAQVEPMKIRKMPMTAALIMPDSLKETNSVHDVSCAGYYSVPIGLELENTLTGALSQVFERWTPLPTERMGRAIMM